MGIKEILHKFPSQDRLQMEFTSCESELMPERALTSFTLYVTRVASLWVRREKVGHAQNIPTDNIFVFG